MTAQVESELSAGTTGHANNQRAGNSSGGSDYWSRTRAQWNFQSYKIAGRPGEKPAHYLGTHYGNPSWPLITCMANAQRAHSILIGATGRYAAHTTNTDANSCWLLDSCYRNQWYMNAARSPFELMASDANPQWWNILTHSIYVLRPYCHKNL